MQLPWEHTVTQAIADGHAAVVLERPDAAGCRHIAVSLTARNMAGSRWYGMHWGSTQSCGGQVRPAWDGGREELKARQTQRTGLSSRAAAGSRTPVLDDLEALLLPSSGCSLLVANTVDGVATVFLGGVVGGGAVVVVVFEAPCRPDRSAQPQRRT